MHKLINIILHASKRASCTCSDGYNAKKKKLTNKAHPALRVLSCMEILTATIKCAYA